MVVSSLACGGELLCHCSAWVALIFSLVHYDCCVCVMCMYRSARVVVERR